MKHVVSISLGSSNRDKKVEFKLGNEPIVMERIGCDGDEKKARALFAEMDGKVDAFGVGGVELYVRVENKSYPLRSGVNMIKDVKNSLHRWSGVKMAIEGNIFQSVEPLLNHPLTPRKAMMPLAADRFPLAKSLHTAGFDLVFCDLMFGLGVPIPVKGIDRLKFLASIIVPVVGLMPISVLYPTGQDQDKIKPKYENWYNYGPVIAGDFQYIRRHLPDRLDGKIIITNTTTEKDVELLQSRGVSYLVTSTPRVNGRSFGTNVLEAALIAYAGKGRELTDDEMQALVTELNLKPTIQELNPI